MSQPKKNTRASRLNKVKEWHVKGNYGRGWEIVYTGENKQDAQERLKEYKINEPQYPHKLGFTWIEA